MTDEQIKIVEGLAKSIGVGRTHVALTALLTELNEMRELLEAADGIEFKNGTRIDQPCAQDEGVQCWHYDHDGRCDLFDSVLDAYREVKKQGEGK